MIIRNKSRLFPNFRKLLENWILPLIATHIFISIAWMVIMSLKCYGSLDKLIEDLKYFSENGIIDYKNYRIINNILQQSRNIFFISPFDILIEFLFLFILGFCINIMNEMSEKDNLSIT